MTRDGVQAKRPPFVAVPEGDGAPVLTDGIFSPGEWDDALRLFETVLPATGPEPPARPGLTTGWYDAVERSTDGWLELRFE
jgi:hypothetical protein